MNKIIIDPLTNKKINIFSKEGKQLLKNYVKSFLGGSNYMTWALGKVNPKMRYSTNALYKILKMAKETEESKRKQTVIKLYRQLLINLHKINHYYNSKLDKNDVKEEVNRLKRIINTNPNDFRVIHLEYIFGIANPTGKEFKEYDKFLTKLKVKGIVDDPIYTFTEKNFMKLLNLEKEDKIKTTRNILKEIWIYQKKKEKYFYPKKLPNLDNKDELEKVKSEHKNKTIIEKLKIYQNYYD